MGLTVTFYTSTANPKQLDKTGYLTAIGTAKTLHVKHKIDLLNPVFEVDYNSLFLPANYIYISEFGRYYFVTIATDTAQRMTITGTVDVLYSHAAQIKNCPCTVIRSENAGVNYVIDSKLPIDPNNFVTQGLNFSGIDYTGDGHNYILVLSKGGGN